MKPFIFILLIIFMTTSAYSFTLSNFETPESVVVDPHDGSYYISNINGDFSAKDGNGYISRVNAQGNIVIQKYIGGGAEPVLNAPKGMAIAGSNLYVTDIDTVKVFDKKSRELKHVVDFSKFKPKFLNDIAVDYQGNIYVTGTLSNRIFKITPPKNYEVSLYKQGSELGGPSGITFNPKNRHMIVVSREKGQILEIDRFGRAHVLKRGLHSLEGVDLDDKGNLYVSSFEKGEIYQIPNFGRGQVSIFLSGLTTPSDISFDKKKNELLVPSFQGNTVISQFRRE